MSSPARLRPLLATARIANVPSVISNVWVGIAIGAAFQRWEHGGESVWPDALCLMIAGILLYIGGNFLNDWHDREWDAKNRPERALPTGLYAPGTYLLLAIIFELTGLLLALAVSWKCAVVAALIILFIIIYTRWHKKAVWPVIPMGLCRALLPVMGFVGFGLVPLGIEIKKLLGYHLPTPATIVLFHAVALLIYIAALSLGARYESSPNPSRAALAVSKAGLILSGLIASVWWINFDIKAGLIGLIPFTVWIILCLTKYRRPIPVHVSALLAGIPLIDGIAMLAYFSMQPVSTHPPALQPYLIACLIIPPLAFLTGRALQRLAPAT